MTQLYKNSDFRNTRQTSFNAVVHDDIAKLRQLLTDCIYYTFRVTDTEENDSLFPDLQNKNEQVGYDKLCNKLSYIAADAFLKEDFKVIFDSKIIKRIGEKFKLIFSNEATTHWQISIFVIKTYL